MQDETSESKTFDVQYSIRLPEDLATEINARAAAEGVKPSTWIRNCITSAIRQKNEVNADMFRTPLLMLLKQDEGVRALIRDIGNEKLPKGEQLRKKCENLTTTISAMEMRIKENEMQFRALTIKSKLLKTNMQQLECEIEVLKQASDEAKNNEKLKGMIDSRTADLKSMMKDQVRIDVSLSDLSKLLKKEANLRSDLVLEQACTMEQLKALELPSSKYDSP